MKDKILVTIYVCVACAWIVGIWLLSAPAKGNTITHKPPSAEQADHIKILDSKLLNLGRTIFLISVDGDKYLVTDHPSFIVPVQER